MVSYPVKNQKIFIGVYPDKPSSAGDRASRLWTQKFAADRLDYSDVVCYNYGRQARHMIREIIRYVL